MNDVEAGLSWFAKLVKALPALPLTASFLVESHAYYHPFVASTMCRMADMRWRRVNNRRRKRRARWARGKCGVRPRMRGAR